MRILVARPTRSLVLNVKLPKRDQKRQFYLISFISLLTRNTAGAFLGHSQYFPELPYIIKSSRLFPNRSISMPTTVAKSKSSGDSADETVGTKRSRSASPPKKKIAGTAEQGNKKKAPAHQVFTERDEIPKLHDAQVAEKERGSYTFRVGSWNVAGLRALMKKDPQSLAALVKKYDLDVLCLQETKLQEQHLNDPKLKINEILVQEGFEAYHSVSTEKKGYSGTATFVRKPRGGKIGKQQTLDGFFGASASTLKTLEKQNIDPELLVPEVSYAIGGGHDTEGRTIILDFPLFSLFNVYVPNSGQDLKRLDYRVNDWDKYFLSVVQKKRKDRGVPVMWLGDLNIAHTNLEVWNDGAKHLPKQAGVTPEERASFQEQLDAGFVDAFRRLHPEAKGHYSYWSTRAGNREPNKGLRLDYFICDPMFFEEDSRVVVRDSYCCHEVQGSDHCPVVVEIEIKKA